MKFVLLIWATVLAAVHCQLWMETGNPWIDTTSCPPMDTEKVCSLKKKQCAPVNNIIKPPGQKGLVGLIRYCAAVSGVALNLKFFFKVGISYAHNNPESLMDTLSSDPKVSASIRACVLNSTGLIDPDGKFNRTAAMDRLTRQPLGPNLVVPVFKGLITCPEPEDYKIGPFLSCLRKACLASATAIFPPWEMEGDESSLEPSAAGMEAPAPGMPGYGAGMPGYGAGMPGYGAGMAGYGAGMKPPTSSALGSSPVEIIGSVVKKLAPGLGGGGSSPGAAPWASFIPSPGSFGGASGPGGASAFGPGSFVGAPAFGSGSFGGGGSKAGPGSGGKWF